MRWHSVVLSARTSTKTHLGHGRSGAGQLLGRRGITAASSASEDQVFCCSGGSGGGSSAAAAPAAGGATLFPASTVNWLELSP